MLLTLLFQRSYLKFPIPAFLSPPFHPHLLSLSFILVFHSRLFSPLCVLSSFSIYSQQSALSNLQSAISQ